jgi:hypothetical protein
MRGGSGEAGGERHGERHGERVGGWGVRVSAITGLKNLTCTLSRMCVISGVCKVRANKFTY